MAASTAAAIPRWVSSCGGEAFTIVILECAHDVGGLWRDNTYPEVGADILSFNHLFSFEKNPRWSRLFPKGQKDQALYRSL